MNETIGNVLARCRSILSRHGGSPASTSETNRGTLPPQPHEIATAEGRGADGYLTDLLRVSECMETVATQDVPLLSPVSEPSLNPTLNLIAVGWTQLPLLVYGSAALPEPGSDFVMLWRHPGDGTIRLKSAEPDELLIVKTLVEGLSLETISRDNGVSLTIVNRLVRRAAGNGLILAPPSQIRRPSDHGAASSVPDEQFRSADMFTLQWHITQTCDLHCRHCYDRSTRTVMTMDQALHVLDDFGKFVSARNAGGHVTFTGGNPLLYPRFHRLYAETSERGFETSILGNPATRDSVRELVGIQQPDLYQISLEGLREHNDAMRGEGHFDRALAFLDILREEGVHAMVMLTLTRDNMDQVIPLTRVLRDRADTFHFNRLSPVGEGADLILPDREAYVAFLEAYLEESTSNPILGLKDNLINILRHRRGEPVFGGCTGYGCGAAFNFLAVLPDGEVHACRKFPSPIGNVFAQGFAEVYDSIQAKRYRTGCVACNDCGIRPVCGGCLAMVNGFGGDFSRDKDPFCFVETAND